MDKNFPHPKLKNDDAFLFGMVLNHLIVFALFFHCLAFVFSTNALFILSRIDLLILPIFDLEGLINRNVGKLEKVSFYGDKSFWFMKLLDFLTLWQSSSPQC